MNRGVIYGLAAYGLWGLLPIFWKLLDHVPPIEILSHRILWSLVLCTGLLAIRKRWAWIMALLRDPKGLVACVGTTILLSFNWWFYIWAVNSGHIVETSLGYFINPLVSVALGVIVLHERLNRLQWIAVGLATMGVFVLAFVLGRPPWIALALASTFGLYGLLKKQAKLPALEGLTVESAFVALPALGFLLWQGFRGESHFFAGARETLLLMGAGVATATPLLFFAAAAQRIPLTLLGILQYIAPSTQFVLGVFVYGEYFDGARLVGFVIIWLGLAVFAFNAMRSYRRRAQP